MEADWQRMIRVRGVEVLGQAVPAVGMLANIVIVAVGVSMKKFLNPPESELLQKHTRALHKSTRSAREEGPLGSILEVSELGVGSADFFLVAFGRAQRRLLPPTGSRDTSGRHIRQVIAASRPDTNNGVGVEN
ncbi:hypothetical protein B0H14DRAFT_2564224 [Mycena olivaceomarginata]|nr:hypothetical protein B0H14DRAFT_2564224 [Mycena olivaceomarginata]